MARAGNPSRSQVWVQFDVKVPALDPTRQSS
jgi:hypothetical protein